MCHVLVVNYDESLTAKKKKEFEEVKRAEIRQRKTNPTIKFIYGCKESRRTKRQIQRFRERHKSAEIQRIEEPALEVAMAS